LPRPNCSRSLPRPLKIPSVMTLKTIADVRELSNVTRPPNARKRDTWRPVSKLMAQAARGGDINDAVVSLRLVCCSLSACRLYYRRGISKHSRRGIPIVGIDLSPLSTSVLAGHRLRQSRYCSIIGIANPHPVPTISRWHPPPATVVADADSAGEDCEVVSVPEVNKVMKVSETVSWKDRAMVERVGHAKVVWAAEAMDAAKAAHAAKAVATKTTHLGGQRHWREKHRHHDSTSDRYFAEHDNPPDCHKLPPRHK
jgi:hypothetical protein